MLACSQRVGKLRQSVGKTRALSPLAIARAQSLTDDEGESIDALILRYSQCDQSQARADQLNLIISESESESESEFVVSAFESIEMYLLRKGFAP
jgi:hypothetical protein